MVRSFSVVFLVILVAKRCSSFTTTTTTTRTNNNNHQKIMSGQEVQELKMKSSGSSTDNTIQEYGSSVVDRRSIMKTCGGLLLGICARPTPVFAKTDCMSDCLKNCKLIAPKVIMNVFSKLSKEKKRNTCF